MGYTTWHVYGYGICISEIDEVSVERIEALLEHAPVLKKDIHAWFSECGIESPTTDDYLEFDQDYMLGLASLLAHVIEEAEHIRFTPCDNFEGERYLVYSPPYPWELSSYEILLTKERVDQIFDRYISIISDQTLSVEYYSIENGG